MSLARYVQRTVLLGLISIGLSACGVNEPPGLGPTEGWHGTAARWWRPDVDTARAFRDLESLESMGVSHVDMSLASVSATGMPVVAEDQLMHGVKRSLIRLYRNEPEVVDSLFEQFVTPEIQTASGQGDPGQYVETYKRRGYELITNHFKEPLASTHLGTDVPVTYPDSLRQQGVSGSVRLQIYVDQEGEPQAIQVLEGVHPVLDALALRATSQMTWRPAYLLRSGSWRPIPAWTVLNVTYQSRAGSE